MTRTGLITLMLVLASTAPMFLVVSTARGQSGDREASPELVDFSFPGGTIAEYLDALRQKIGDRINIVVADQPAGQARLPAVQLNDVDLQSAVHLVSGDYRLDDGTLIGVHVDSVGRLGQQIGTPLFRVASMARGREAPTRVKVWSLFELLADELKADDVLTAVETAVRLADAGSESADVRYHEATSLLIATGTPAQIDAIDGVIDQLLDRQDRRHQERAAVQGVEDFVTWIQQMREFDQSQRALAGQATPDVGVHPDQPPTGDLRGEHETKSDREGRLQSEIDRLAKLVEDQSKTIRSIEKRLDAAPKK